MSGSLFLLNIVLPRLVWRSVPLFFASFVCHDLTSETQIHQLYTVYSTVEQGIAEMLKIQIFTVILMATLNYLPLLNLLLSLYILV